MRNRFFFPLLVGIVLCSCKVTGQITQSVINDFLNDSAVRTGHVGISIYEPATGKYLYNYNEEKNFIPSSNVKLFTLYAGMKYLGDSIVGLRYYKIADSITVAFGTGDPSFLHGDFISQPVFDFLEKQDCITFRNTWLARMRLGTGWAWDDYEEEFMQERSGFPIYGNLIRLFPENSKLKIIPQVLTRHLAHVGDGPIVLLRRDFDTNILTYHRNPYGEKKSHYAIPMVTSEAIKFLGDTLHKAVEDYGGRFTKKIDSITQAKIKIIYSRPVDSLFRPMMFNSDNFFAEQTLLMVSNEKLGYMSDSEIIDTLLAKELKDIPTKPRWVDGSGLSRYNLFSPKDFIYILNKIKNEFGEKRVNNILPAGGQGTLTGYYEKEGAAIHAKSGSMSNNVSLSGYLVTEKNRELLFSVIVNNFSGSGRSCRKAIERFLKNIRRIN